MAEIPDGYVPLAGSERSVASGASLTGPADPEEVLTVSVRVRRSPDAAELPDFTSSAQRGRARVHLSRDEMAARYGAVQADLDQVAAFGQANGLTVVESSGPRRTVQLRGTAAQLSSAFAVDLGRYECALDDGESYRGREGQLHLPGDLADIVTGVFGLDDRRMARRPVLAKAGAPAEGTSLTPVQVAALYNFPRASTKTQTIGLLEFSGGYLASDLAAYFTNVGISPGPTVSPYSVDGVKNSPSSTNPNLNYAVTLDIDVAGSVAQDANIVVYFAPPSEQGLIDAITTAAYDNVNQPTVLAIGYGTAESLWTTAAMRAVSESFQEAAAMGVTVLAASGDTGSAGGLTDGAAHVLYPASDPHVTACGGTEITVTGNTFTENTWNEAAYGATGGGVSALFKVPDYQKIAQITPLSVNSPNTTGRGVPDIAANASHESGFPIPVIGTTMTGYGTGVATALYAGLVAQLNAATSAPVGFLNPDLYELAANAYALTRDIDDNLTNAFDGAPGYAATGTTSSPWNACTGLGSVNGGNLLGSVERFLGAMYLTSWHGGAWTIPVEVHDPYIEPGMIITVAQTYDGVPGSTQFLFAMADKNLWHATAKKLPNGLFEWYDVTKVETLTGPAPSIGAAWDGNAVGVSQYIYVDPGTGAAWLGTWTAGTSSWASEPLSTYVTVAGAVNVVAATGDGVTGETQYVFTTAGGVLWHCLVNPTTGWQQPKQVSIPVPIAGPVTAIAATPDGITGEAQFLFATRTVTAGPPPTVREWGLWHTLRDPNGKWWPLTAPESLPAIVDVRGPVHAVSATYDGNVGETQYVWADDDGTLYHALRLPGSGQGNGQWSQAGDVFEQFGGQYYGPVHAVAVAAGWDGYVNETVYVYVI